MKHDSTSSTHPLLDPWLCVLFATLIGFAGTADSALGQLPLEPAASIGSADGPNAITLADLDGDGDLDAIGAAGPDATAGEVAWWPFDATSGWGTKVTIDGAFPFAKDVLAADLDRDGDLDVVAASFEEDRVAWWENTAGDGSTWSLAKGIVVGADGIVALTIGDVDGDGHPDVVGAARSGGEIGWYENDGSPGDGGWTTHIVNAAAFSEPTGVALGDIDRDGDLDVVAASRLGDSLAWWESDGSPGDDLGGDGNSWTFHALASSLDGARDVALTDLDGDGDLDVAVVSVVGDTISWVENVSGDGGLWAAATTIGTLDGPRDLVARDLDLDGDVDLLSAGQDGDRVVWWENREGNATAWSEHQVEAAFDGARAVAVGDVDRDGDLDVAATGLLADSLRWWRNDPIGRSVAFAENLVTNDLADAAVAADLDRDGDLDVVGGGLLRWYERQGTLWVAHDVDLFAGITGLLQSVAVADLDRDGDPDIAGANLFRVFWWENDGSPLDDTGGGLGTSWTRHEVSNGHMQAQGVSIADLDRDGFLDLVAFDLAADRVLWWENDGSPGDDTGGDGNSWTERIIDSATDAPRAALVRDVDRDGDPDVVVAAQIHNPAGERISWWQNNGTGTSWTRRSIGTGTPLVAAVADVDNDGDLDVLTGEGTGSGEGRLQLTRQQPPGNGTAWFSPSSQVGVLDTGQPFVNELSVADLDLDGDPDAVAVGDRDSLYRFDNPGGTATWTREDVSVGLFEVDFLAVQEAGGSSAPDLLVASSFDDRIAIFENRAAQARLLATDVSTTPLPIGAPSAALRIEAISLGRLTDPQVEIAALELLLERSPGDPLDGAEASSVLAALRFYEDLDGSGDFDPGPDLLIAELLSPSPTAGSLTFTLPDFTNTIGTISPRTYFLVVETTPDAPAQATDTIRITLRTSRSRMEDTFYDTPLALQSPQDISTQVLDIIDPNLIFTDGFESGDATGWTAVVM